MKNLKSIVIFLVLQGLGGVFLCTPLQAKGLVAWQDQIVKDQILDHCQALDRMVLTKDWCDKICVHLKKNKDIDESLIDRIFTLFHAMHDEIVSEVVAYLLQVDNQSSADLQEILIKVVIKHVAIITCAIYTALVAYVTDPTVQSYDKVCQLAFLVIVIAFKSEMEKKVAEFVMRTVKIVE